MSIWAKIFGGGVVGSIERMATEFIDTDMEKAEAKALFVKTLDPNGIMRREISQFSCRAYGSYLVIMTVLALLHAFGVGESENTKEALSAMTGLFLPITTAWGGIVGASFGVNGLNTYKDKP